MAQKNALDKLKYHYTHRDAAARDWKARGGLVAGYICNSIPEELFWAAGIMPVRLSGTPGGDVSELTKWFNVNKYTEGFVNTMLNELITGQYDYLDYLIMPHTTRNTLQTQYPHLHIVKELWPETNKLPELYFIEGFQSWSHNSLEYYTETLRELKAQLETWTGRVLSERVLNDAIDLCNHSRELLKKVQALRDERRISGTDAMQIFGSSWFMDKDEHNRLLEIFLSGAETLPILPGKRVFIEGSPEDNLQLYSLVESCGALIVNEDNCWSSRSTEDMVDQKRFPDPLEAIAQRYHYKSPCSYVFFPAEARCAYCKRKVAEIPVDGVIFYILENDAHGLWDYIDQLQAYKEKGLPCLELLEQPYLLANAKELSAKVTDFVAGL